MFLYESEKDKKEIPHQAGNDMAGDGHDIVFSKFEA